MGANVWAGVKNRKCRSVILFLCFFLLSGYHCIEGAEEGYVKPRLAVVTFDTKNVDEATVQSVSELVQSRFENSCLYEMVERSQVEKVFKEQVFQYSGSVDETTAIKAGKMLGASKLVLGSINKMGNGYVTSGRIVDVETGMIEMSDTETSVSVLDIKESIELLVKTLVSKDRSRFLSFLSIAVPERGMAGFYLGLANSFLSLEQGEETVGQVSRDNLATSNTLKASLSSASPSTVNVYVGLKYFLSSKTCLDVAYVPAAPTKDVSFSVYDVGINYTTDLKYEMTSGPSYMGSIDYVFSHSKKLRFTSILGAAFSTLSLSFKDGPVAYAWGHDPYSYYLFPGQVEDRSYFLYFVGTGMEWFPRKEVSVGFTGNYFLGAPPEIGLTFKKGAINGGNVVVPVFKPKVNRFNSKLSINFYF